jgi:hypothetical protein
MFKLKILAHFFPAIFRPARPVPSKPTLHIDFSPRNRRKLNYAQYLNSLGR